MTESGTGDEVLLSELYASFGLAYYHSETLCRALCVYSVLLDVSKIATLTSPRFNEKLTAAFAITFGAIVNGLRGKIPDDEMCQLDELLDKRNYLAHEFWFRCVHRMFSASDIAGLVSELHGLGQVFSDATELFQSRCAPYLEKLGVTEALMRNIALGILCEGEECSLPEKKEAQVLEKSLKAKQRLIRVWEVPYAHASKTIVFELEGGILRQLCEVGLGLTLFNAIKADWREHPAVSPYVPADILPRPKGVEPWRYQFNLQKGAVLWVTPGKGDNSFVWGVRKGHGVNHGKQTSVEIS